MEELRSAADECDRNGLEWTRVDWSGHFFRQKFLDAICDGKMRDGKTAETQRRRGFIRKAGREKGTWGEKVKLRIEDFKMEIARAH